MLWQPCAARIKDLMSLYNGPTFTVLAMLRIPSASASSTTHRTTQLSGQGMRNEAKRRPDNYSRLYNQSRGMSRKDNTQTKIRSDSV